MSLSHWQGTNAMSTSTVLQHLVRLHFAGVKLLGSTETGETGPASSVRQAASACKPGVQILTRIRHSEKDRPKMQSSLGVAWGWHQCRWQGRGQLTERTLEREETIQEEEQVLRWRPLGLSSESGACKIDPQRAVRKERASGRFGGSGMLMEKRAP